MWFGTKVNLSAKMPVDSLIMTRLKYQEFRSLWNTWEGECRGVLWPIVLQMGWELKRLIMCRAISSSYLYISGHAISVKNATCTEKLLTTSANL